MARPVWKRAARTAACVLLACLVTLGGLMAVSPAVRAAVLGWFHQVQEDLVTFINPKRTVAEDPPGGWRLSEIPEGFVLTDVSPKESSGYWRYYEPGTGAWLWFAVYTPEAGEVATNVDGASDAGENHTTVTVQGYQADLFQSEGTILLTWQNEAGYLFMLRATDFGDTETLLSMAEGVVPYEGPGVAWEMGWVPEGYEPMYRDEGAGAVQQVWVRDGTTLTWQYVTDPICPFETPEGEPEEIDLRGVTGWYWTAEEEPEESEGPTITVNGKEIQAEGSSVTVGGVTVELSDEKQQRLAEHNVAEQDVTLGVRPDHLMLCADGIKGTVDVSEMMGSSVHLHVAAEGKDVIVIVPTNGAAAHFPMGSEVNMIFGGNVAHVFDKETGKNLEW